jgi:parallel beta-helix repeat protein
MSKLVMAVLGYMLIIGSANADDCGCVGTTQTFGWGDTITESCTLNCDLASDGTCWTVGTDNITIDGAGYSITEQDTSGGGYSGIDLNGRSNVTIRNIEIYQFAYGIRVENSDNIEIHDSVISDNKWWYGIYFYNTDNSTISGTSMEGNGLRTGGEAIAFNNSSDNIINGNIINDNGTGIFLFNSSNTNTITDNTVTTNERDGIYISSSSSGNVLNSNTFCSNGWSTYTDYDINDAGGSSNTGDNNFCDTTYDYNDTGTTG